MKSNRDEQKRIPGSVFGFLLVMLIFDAFLAWMVWQQLKVARWPTVPAVVEDVSIEQEFSSTSSLILRCPRVTFRYEVEGESFQSDTWRPGGFCSSDLLDADRLLQDLDLGGEVRAYYDPEDPGTAYLSAGFGRVEHTVLFFFLPFNLFALGWVAEILFSLLTGRRLKEAQLRLEEGMSRSSVVFPRLDPMRFALGIVFILSFLLIFPLLFFFDLMPESLFPWLWRSLAGLFVTLFVGKALWNRLNRRIATYDQPLEELRLPGGQTFHRSEVKDWRVDEVRSGKGRSQFGVELVLREPAGGYREGTFPLLKSREEAYRLCDWLARTLELEDRSSP